MSEQYVSLEVHTEFAKRIDAENNRQNKRIESLEHGLTQVGELVASVKVLATNMENMNKELAKQGEKLEEIEAKPGKRWETVVACVITSIVTAIMTMVLSGIIH